MTAGSRFPGVPGAAALAAAALLAGAALLATGLPSPGTPLADRGELEASIAEAPLAFEPNAGRAGREIEFLAHSIAGGSLYLTPCEAVLSLPQERRESRSLRLGFPGAGPEADVRGADELPGKANSFIGDDRARWKNLAEHSEGDIGA
jgi:hypothetical protein